MSCPYGEKRGRVVFCRVQGKNVNTLVFPCLTKRYERCKFYAKAKEAEEKPAPAAEVREKAEIPRQAEVKPEKPAAREWSEERSRRLLDPSVIARIVIGAPSVRRLRVEAKNLSDLAQRLSEKLDEWKSKCYVIKADMAGESLHLEYCYGNLVASVRRNGVIKPDEINSLLERAGEVSLTVYGPFEESVLEQWE